MTIRITRVGLIWTVTLVALFAAAVTVCSNRVSTAQRWPYVPDSMTIVPAIAAAVAEGPVS